MRIPCVRLLITAFCLTATAEDVSLQFPDRDSPASYGAVQLQRALEADGDRLVDSPAQARFSFAFETTGYGTPESYLIRTQQESGRTHIRIEGTDARGALYGALAITESLENGVPLNRIQDSSVTARFPFRAIKFNLPWYSYRAGFA